MAPALPKHQTARSRSLLSTPQRLQTNLSVGLKGSAISSSSQIRRNTLLGWPCSTRRRATLSATNQAGRRHSFLSGEAFGETRPSRESALPDRPTRHLGHRAALGPRRGRGPPRSRGLQMRQRSEQPPKLSALLAQTSSTTTAPNASDHGAGSGCGVQSFRLDLEFLRRRTRK